MNPYFIKGDQRAILKWEDLVRQMFSPAYLAMTPDTP
jgi:hypothetical protein